MARKEELTHELIQELCECREDERNSQNQFFQVITAAGALLSVLFGITFFNKSGSDLNKSIFLSNQFHAIPKEVIKYFTSARLIFILNNLVFITAFGYSIYLGLINTLRYHYVQYIEDKLYKLTYQNTKSQKNRANLGNHFLHWGNFSSPIITKNRKHITSIHTVLAYWSYALTIIASTLFSIILTFIQYGRIDPVEWYDKIGLFFVMGILVGGVLLFFHTAHRASSMSKFAAKTAYYRLNKRMTRPKDQQSENSAFNNELLYLLYPRRKDIEKPLFIVAVFIVVSLCLGYTNNSPTGISLGQGGITLSTVVNSFSISSAIRLINSLFVFDFCLYQARFQINDIRGIREDKILYPDKRLIRNSNRTDRAQIRMSLEIVAIRIGVAILYTLFFASDFFMQYFIYGLIIAYLTVVYEYFKKQTRCMMSDILCMLWSLSVIVFCFATFVSISVRLFYIFSFIIALIHYIINQYIIKAKQLFIFMIFVLCELLTICFLMHSPNLHTFKYIGASAVVFFCTICITAHFTISIESTFVIFHNVGLGYSLRAAVASLAAVPNIWVSTSFKSFFGKLGILIIISLFGSMSCILVWANEVSSNYREFMIDLKQYPKRYLQYLHNHIYGEQSSIVFRDSSNSNEEFSKYTHPLRAKGTIRDIWNQFYIACIFLTLIVRFVFSSSDILLVIPILICAILTILNCNYSSQKGIIITSILCCILDFICLCIFWISATSYNAFVYYFVLTLLSIFIQFVYSLIRYSPQLEAIDYKKLLRKLARIILGRDAYDSLSKKE